MRTEWTDVCESIARNAVHGFFAPGMEREDLLQEARIGVLYALEHWCPERGSAFAPFAYRAARARVGDAVKGALRLKHRALNEARSFAEPAIRLTREVVPLGDTIADDRRGPVDRVLAREEAARVAAGWDRLTEIEREAVTRCAIAGESYAAVGPFKSVDNALQRARHKLAVAA